jgi:hypothetical protein
VSPGPVEARASDLGREVVVGRRDRHAGDAAEPCFFSSFSRRTAFTEATRREDDFRENETEPVAGTAKLRRR